MADPNHLPLLYHFCRLRLPAVALPFSAFTTRTERSFAAFCVQAEKESQPATWARFVENMHVLDWFLACACMEGMSAAWEHLFGSRASRTEALLVDALRSRAVRLFPRDPERQEEAVLEFWGYLLAGEREGSTPILARYDGLRPLVPWLIRVFQNRHLSELRKHKSEVAMPEEDVGESDTYAPEESEARWHVMFRDAAHDWFADLSDQEVLLLGLRLRYRQSQREMAKLLGIHEGNITRKIDALSKAAHERIGNSLREQGWTGEDLIGFIRKEMASVLFDEPRFSADRLAALLAARGQTPPPLEN